jgi:hypothetical protein
LKLAFPTLPDLPVPSTNLTLIVTFLPLLIYLRNSHNIDLKQKLRRCQHLNQDQSSWRSKPIQKLYKKRVPRVRRIIIHNLMCIRHDIAGSRTSSCQTGFPISEGIRYFRGEIRWDGTAGEGVPIWPAIMAIFAVPRGNTLA